MRFSVNKYIVSKINLLNLFYIKDLCYGTDPFLLFDLIFIVTE
jgi:hypothetical protein